MFVTDPILIQQLAQDHSVKMRPPRSSDAPNIAQKLDPVFMKELEEIAERVPAMADGVDLP
jgi:hypothetical protein